MKPRALLCLECRSRTCEHALPRVKHVLTPREIQLLKGLMNGPSKNRDLAIANNLTIGTVKVYLTHLFDKLNVLDRHEAADWARDHQELLLTNNEPTI